MNKNSYLQKIITTLLVVLVLTINIYSQTATPPSGGDGTEGNPYQIASLDNLYWLSQDTTQWSNDKYFLQTANIDASSTSSWDGGKGFFPIGNDSVYFRGTYNGNGYSISGLFINRSNYVALFGVTIGEIKNLAITNVNITGNYNVGALVGKTYSLITNCYSTGTVSGDYAGGLIGYAIHANISTSFSTCSISGNIRIGGFIGYLDGGNINNCYSRGDVTKTDGNNEEIGGFCGSTVYDVVIEYCYSTGRVTYDNDSNPYDKGLVGEIVQGNNARFTANYFDTNTSHQTSGPTDAAVRTSTIDMQNAKTFTTDSYRWDFVNNPNNDSQNEDIWGINPGANDGYPILVWSDYTNYLEPPSNGDGTSENPYQITDLQDLYWLSQIDIDGKYFLQSSDIDATPTSSWCGGLGFLPIGYYGNTKSLINYNGNNHSIDGLFINRVQSYVSLFGYLENCVIKSLEVSNVNIEGGSYSAALIGRLSGSNSIVSNCASSGTVTGSYVVGGLVGNISTSVTVKTSYSTCSVSGYNQTGGFFGYNYFGNVTNCYSRGDVNRSNYSSLEVFGGFGGYVSDATIENCYSTGSVNYGGGSAPNDKGFLGGLEGQTTFTANFFDSETSQQTSDNAGAATAKTSNEMKDYTTFTATGWDFVDETNNGTNNYWDADQNQTVNNGYVILAWQSGADNTLPVELTTFTAIAENGIVKLNWQTATEVNNYGFSIERSSLSASPIKTWDKIGFVEGHGNSNAPIQYSFSDNNVSSGKYFYRLKQIDIDGSFDYSKTMEVEIATPTKFELAQNYPNPFNPTTTIQYSIPVVDANFATSNVTLKVFDVLGRKVATLVNEKQKAGIYKVQFNASELSSGIYYYKLTTNNFTKVKQMLLVK